MNNPTYTDRQVALQAAVEYSKTSGNINSSFDVVMVAERFRKFLEEGIVEQKAKTGSVTVNGAEPMTKTGYDIDREILAAAKADIRDNNNRWRPRVGNG